MLWVCGSKAVSSPQLSTKEDLPHSSGPLPSQTQSQSALQPRERPQCLPTASARGSTAGLWRQEQEFQAKLSLKGGEYKTEHNHILFKFFFIFLHTGKSSEGA